MSGGSRRAARSRGRPSPGEADAAESARGPRPVEGIRKGRSRDHGPIQLRDVSLKTLLGLGFLASLFLFFLVNNYQWGSRREDPVVRKLRRAVTPLPAPRMMDLPQLLMINIRRIPFLAIWLGSSFKESTRRVCTGAPTDLTCTLESEPGTGLCDDLVLLLSFAPSVDLM
ncbi:hypothetical protein BHE74_00000374 [Ensete ventricosum]|nr:hypothetical protein BHE74_00000374 [Ensete ventricosum]